MRVIAGIHKGRQLKPVPNHKTRPTTDKVKESVFQIIGPYFEGGQVLDLFAGSGGLGIEALSRGAEQCVFVDQQQKAIQVIHENLETLRLKDQAEIFRTDALRAIKAAGKRGLTFQYIFLDPPYKKFSYEDLLEALIHEGLTDSGTTIVCEHDAAEDIPAQVGQFKLIKSEKYGSNIGVSIFRYEVTK
ncbi:16S rRNA (guanine(966)-N(2))-methyltransferase RsmD [Halobacillus naozhouensis]|uniref:16S rRNA (Guanine(966)-N(2))-methyltransferase RsmD n=2 Tax=Halobacillus naozhouensis TaxID=554880 RepID=A0ABY8J6A3_9BACI|nr:16S rRNA (guanine(966)-N(2))-methyltransferase RsmD [Halobacillus naozhouensis]WFT76943.1 16S rRNA (guanine(966)-N(2))-methyltransferase RsmD [Halobacillus naozhouensis]